ncbi:MAG: DinB family protein [Gammaproteobacteria bacterium]|nr:DinB family protein [Gammaproteobacteria bacterium]
MADYNAWMNQRLFAVCGQLDDAERKRDKGAFFGSVHRTLNHILYGDLAFMSRFTGVPPEVPALGVDLYDDFEELWLARRQLDERIHQWVSTIDAQWLGVDLTYTSNVDGITRTVPRWVLVTHMFNHETHHRGQITTMLSQAGLDVGSTDLPFMPGF